MEIFTQEFMIPAIWLILTIAFIVIEAMTTGIVTIWFAVGALSAFIIALCDGNLVVQIVAFVVVSIVLLIFTRKIFVQRLKTGTEKTNVDALIGQTAIVTTDITSMKTGTVRVDGKEWTAVALNEAESFKIGDRVIVERIEGVKLVVSLAQ